MAKVDTSAYRTFDDVSQRLDEIVKQVKAKDTSLERSLDLLDEAVALSSKAVDLVDVEDPSAKAAEGQGQSAEGQDKPSGAGA